MRSGRFVGEFVAACIGIALFFVFLVWFVGIVS